MTSLCSTSRSDTRPRFCWYSGPAACPPPTHDGADAFLVSVEARGVSSLHERRRGVFAVSYPGRQVRVPKGLSVLEASLRNKIPHARVCGGPARCSTCRVKVVSDRSALPKPSGRESFVLARVG